MSDKNVITGNMKMVNVTPENAEKETFFLYKRYQRAQDLKASNVGLKNTIQKA